jgi:hypothetical protein
VCPLFSTELGRLPRVRTCANLMRKICYNNKDRMMAGMICGGWDPYEGGQVYEVPLGGTLMQQKFAVGGSGSTYIYGLVDATYKEGMTKEECKTFVKTGTLFVLVACCAVVMLRVRNRGSNGQIVVQCHRWSSALSPVEPQSAMLSPYTSLY